MDMRGHHEQQGGMFSHISPQQRVPQDHRLRRIRMMTDAALQQMSPQFARLYSDLGRPSIAPEKLLRALLLQGFYSVRSERLLMEQLNYNLLFRWFVGMNVDDAVWNVTVFTKNRERLLEEEIAKVFFEEVLAQARPQGLLSDEHFTVDGTLIEAWANRRSFREKQPLQEKKMTQFDRITLDPAVKGGKPSIRGMRVTVGMIVGQIGVGRTIENVLTDYPYLEREDVLQALRDAAWLAEDREVSLPHA
jgi:transposase/uncharacterized protein (DUF433 family)